MTLFEYLAIAYSLIISFTVMRALSGLPHAVDAGRIYWVHLAWLCVNLAVAFQYYWGFWAFREIEWTQLVFLLALANPALLYVMACILTPESPSSVTSWKDYFYSVRVKLFLVGVYFQLVSITTLLVVIRLEFDDPVMLGQFAALPLWIIGAVSARPATHATIAGAAVAVVVFGAFTFLATVT